MTLLSCFSSGKHIQRYILLKRNRNECVWIRNQVFLVINSNNEMIQNYTNVAVTFVIYTYKYIHNIVSAIQFVHILYRVTMYTIPFFDITYFCRSLMYHSCITNVFRPITCGVPDARGLHYKLPFPQASLTRISIA